ncbi:MAG TPA: hypothetical protein VFS75_03180 [Candidatus Paceibacterota bacterium]|nr:hypothetical protein [Candidatus Paceibacterota bacterium]
MKRVLVCDDDEKYRKPVRHIAECYPVRLVEAATFAELMAAAESGEPFSLVILDGMLDGVNTSIPFVERVAAGCYPHLEDAMFLLVSGDDSLRKQEYRLLKENWEKFDPANVLVLEEKGFLFREAYKVFKKLFSNPSP